MKKLIFIIACLFCYGRAHAQSCSLTSGASTSTIQAAMSTAFNNTCTGTANGRTVLFNAGTYNLTSAISGSCNGSAPNPVVITGPAIATFAQPTAIINGSALSANSNALNFGNCTGVTVQNLWFQNTEPIYFGYSNNSNVQILNNWMTSLTDTTSGTNCCGGSSAMYFDGTSAKPPTGSGTSAYVGNLVLNVLIQYNTLGKADFSDNSCPNSFGLPPNGNYEYNGVCSGVFISAGTIRNFHVFNNAMHHINEGVKQLEHATGTTTSDVNSVMDDFEVEYNWFNGIHRGLVEFQGQVAFNPMLVEHNIADYTGGLPYGGSIGFSLACCSNGFFISYGDTSACQTNNPAGQPCPSYYEEDNIIMDTEACTSYHCPVFGTEFFGSGPQAAYNLLEGNFYNGWYYSVNWTTGQSPYWSYPAQISYNYGCTSPAFYATGGQNFVTNELDPVGAIPATIGNNFVTTGCNTALTSIAPVISPGSGSHSSTIAVTLSIPTQPTTQIVQGVNQSIYYTTDGSTPNTSSTRYTGTFNVSPGTTVRAISQWGVPPQPTSLPAGYGYVPSAVVSATYTSSGGVSLSSVTLAFTGGTSSINIGGTVQMVATCVYSDASTTACNTPDVHGNSVTSWSSATTSVATISSSGLLTGIASGTSVISAVAGGISSSSNPTVTVNAVTLTGITIASTGNTTAISIGGTNQVIATCTYSSGPSQVCTGSVTSWSSSNTGVALISNSGLITGVAAGTTTLLATIGSTSSNGLGMTVNPSTPQPTTIQGLTIQGTVTQ